ncbi:MAG: FkbM family methyltransferase [Bacteroidales bacterium]|nr:FkbM family methyltransferase [Bacteroidales bacterium]
MNIKDLVRESLMFFHIDLTQNLKYDRLTKAIMRTHLSSDSNCIDVGCHKGEILEMMLKYAPNGCHFAFEPIPYLFDDLKHKFQGKATIYPYALSDEKGTTTFNLVKNAPAYSGIKQRHYDIDNPNIEIINVEKEALDNLLGDTPIDFIKIDVEGGEFGVLKGAKDILKKNLPIILFECGKGASDYYGTQPVDLFNYLTEEIGLRIFTLEEFIKNGKHLNQTEFADCFESQKEYYFTASK